MELYHWIDQGLHKPGKKPSELARILGIGADKVSRMRNGTRRPQAKELRLIEQYFGEPAPIPDPALPDSLGPEDQVVPIVGYVSAGSETTFFPVQPGEWDDWVPAPENSTTSTVAAEIRGSSLGELFDRWLIFYDDVRRPVTPDLVGKLCIVGLADQRVLVKKIQRSRHGLYNLISNTEPPIRDVTIEWAARVKTMAPR